MSLQQDLNCPSVTMNVRFPILVLQSGCTSLTSASGQHARICKLGQECLLGMCRFTLMCGGHHGLQMFEFDRHGRNSNTLRLPVTPGLVPFKLQMDVKSHLLAVLMRPSLPEPKACHQLQIVEPETGVVPQLPIQRVQYCRTSQP